MNEKLKKHFTSIMLLLLVVGSVPKLIQATTNTQVYYGGTRLNWEFGRTSWALDVVVSKLTTTYYCKRTTVNSVTSGWVSANTPTASVSKNVAWWNNYECYWDVR